MARRRKNSGPDISGVAVLVVLGLGFLVIQFAVAYWPVTIVVIAAGLAGLYWWRRRRIAHEERKQQEADAAWEANRQAWRALEFEPGGYSVFVNKVPANAGRGGVAELVSDLPVFRERPPEDSEDLVERVVHIGPQPVAEGVSQRNAVHLKEALEFRGATVRIKEGGARRTNGSGRREPIPQHVRREVWQRDGGQCVDCGSRERLEYDHIVAVANGGSNTARNIELRCEKCNRSKGASI
jgi:hypothetical protein